MTINITKEQASYLQEYLRERLEENLDLEEAEILHDLAQRLDDAVDDQSDGEELFDDDEMKFGDDF